MAIGNFNEKPSIEQPRPAQTPEKIVRPERGFKLEIPWFRPEKKSEPVPAEKIQENQAAPLTPAAAAPAWQTARANEIDKILADGLNEIFLKMSPADQNRFKAKGEETVKKINLLLSKAKVRVSQIISLIRDWLKMVPGINKFFLEQEVKIKADKILKLKDKF